MTDEIRRAAYSAVCHAIGVNGAPPQDIADAVLAAIAPMIREQERAAHDAEIRRYRHGISMAMGCLDIFKGGDEALAWYRLHDTMAGKEPRAALHSMGDAP